MAHIMAKFIFWFSILALFYTFAGYPIWIWLMARYRGRWPTKKSITPLVSVVIACLNEERNIESRINNLLQSDYPQTHLEIIIVSDGSTDQTVNLARHYREAGVRVLHYAKRRGKPQALNLGVEQANGEVIIFADARQSFEPEAIKELAANFADPEIGAVSGSYVMSKNNGSTIGEGVGFYWQYEAWIRKNEGLFNSIMGATGAIYAIRKNLWKPLPVETILDDVYTPIQIALAGKRVVFEPNAVAHDAVPKSAAREFARKARTLTGNYQLCQLMPRLLFPNTILLWQFWSHKLMRLAAPIFMMILLVANFRVVMKVPTPSEIIFYGVCLTLQTTFYFSVLVGWLLAKANRRMKVFNIAYVFSVMNAAAFVGLLYFVLGKRNVWVRGE
jgi:cellulose synthase/poly-beta-1,6-N-acetylglucosamine synthase-like glycosyltransferase